MPFTIKWLQAHKKKAFCAEGMFKVIQSCDYLG